MGVYRGNEYTGGDDIKKIKSYLLMLNEELRYIFSNLDPEENYSEDALRKYIKSGENIAYLELTAKNLLISMKDAEGNISVLEQTASSLTSRISNAEGELSSVKQTASSLTSRISNAEGELSTVKQTASSLTSRISNAEGDISTVEQTAKKINWVIASGSSSSNFTLTSRMANLVAEQIELTGYVTFNDLKQSGSTTINGNNIKTGDIDASLLKIGGSKVFESVGGKFKIYKDFVPSSISLSNLSVNSISIVNGPTIRGSYGDLSLGVTYGYSKIPSGATDTQIVTAINHIIDWIKRVD
nr:MAG TPA: hypothetical protein [Caudoviricetes sp.]